MTARKPKNVKSDAALDKKLQEIDKLFRDLENDKSLPTFGQHFMSCLMFGTAERVNLKAMYPKTYFKLSKWLATHNRNIVAGRRK